MFKWLKSVILGPQPTGPPQTFLSIDPTEQTVPGGEVSVENDALVVKAQESTTISLFEMENPELDRCIVTYQALAKAEDLNGRAYLEMQMRFPKVGEHSSKGLDAALSGSTDWTFMETPVLLGEGQKPQLLRLNLVVEGQGTIQVKNLEVLKTPVG